MGVCVRECEKVSWTDFYRLFFFSLSLQGTVISRIISPKCLPICLSVLSYWRSLSQYQSTNRKGQGCDSCIPLPILPPSVHLILTQTDSANSFPQIWARIYMQACPSFLCVKKHGTWFVCPHSDLNNVCHIYSWVSRWTRHICSLTIDMLLKTAVGGTTVKYALSMTEPSSIMRTSISSLFLLHFFGLRDKIAPWSECILSHKPLKTRDVIPNLQPLNINHWSIFFELRSIIDLSKTVTFSFDGYLAWPYT